MPQDSEQHGVMPESVRQVKNLTNWKNEPTVADLKIDFVAATSDHDAQEVRVDTWLDNLHMTGAAKLEKKKGKSNIQPKVIRKQAEWRYASLSEPFLSTDDVFNIDPVTFEDKAAAEQNALILNNQFNTKLQKVKFIDEYIRTAVDEGTVIVRTSWVNEEEDYDEEVPVFELVPDESAEAAELHEGLHQLMQQAPERYAKLPEEMQQAHVKTMENPGVYMPRATGETETVTKTRTLRNQPDLEICHYKNVTIDPTAMGDMDKAQFVIYSFETNLSELKKAGIYENLDAINIGQSDIIGDPDHTNTDDSSFNFEDNPRKKFIAYEYWGFWDIDGSGETTAFVATYVGDVMIRLEENPYPDQKLPFVVAKFLPVRRSNYGEPDGELIKDNQKIIGATVRGMVDIMGRSANGQVGSRKDALDVTNRRKFNAGADYEFNGAIDPTQAFHIHKFEEIPNSAQLMLQVQNNEADSLTGVQAFSSGVSGAALGTTATGIRSALDATSKRELGILRRMAEGIKQVGRKIIAMNGQFLDETEVVRVTNAEFVEVRRDDLAGNFDLRLTISTAEADNQKAEELAFMLQTTAQSMGPEFTQLILSDIAKLRKMPSLAQRIIDFKPQPDPMVQEKAALEIELLRAQIANENAKAHENTANGELDYAKVQSELAKARTLGSDADLKDLDFVEKESGVTQERDLEKQGAQARANMDLEVVKSALNKETQTTPAT